MSVPNATVGAVLPEVSMAGGIDEGFDRSAAALGTAVSSLARAVIASGENPASDEGSTEIESWSDSRPFLQQLAAYPATSFLAAIFIMVFAGMWYRRMSLTLLGSTYRLVVLRFEVWRALTAAFVHGGVFHLGFNVIALWRCRRMEAELGSWGYLLASIHLLLLAEFCEKVIQHFVHRVGGLIDEVTVGYSAVVFAWMVVLAMKPDAPAHHFGGLEVGALTHIVFSVIVMKIFARRSSVVANLAGVWVGFVFATGAMDFARTRYWGTGLGAWGIALLLGSLKATAGIPVPLVDYADFTGGNELGVWVTPFNWGSREGWEDYVLSRT